MPLPGLVIAESCLLNRAATAADTQMVLSAPASPEVAFPLQARGQSQSLTRQEA
jgi:hypothetical protein